MRDCDLWILEEFEKRNLKNRQYSLRSFARDLETSPALLSRMFRDELQISTNTAKKILSKIKLKKDEEQRVLDDYSKLDLQIDDTRNRLSKLLEQKRPKNVKYLTTKEFSEVVHWQYSYVYLLLDQTPKNCGLNEAINFVSLKTKFSLEKVDTILSKLASLDLITISEAFVSKKFSSFSIQSIGEEVDMEVLRENFLSSIKEMIDHGRTAYKKNKGFRLKNTQFFNFPSEDHHVVEKVIAGFLEDINQNYKSINHKDESIVSFSLQYFLMQKRILKAGFHEIL